MSTNATFDRDQLRAAGVEGGTVESVLVNEYGFLVLVVRPDGASRTRVLVTIQQDHEGNGPGAAMPRAVQVPDGARIEADASGALVVVAASAEARG